MANHKSALKRNRQSQEQRLRNRANRTRIKTAINAVNEAMAQDSAAKVQESLQAAIPVIDRAAVKGAIHKRNASRKISRLTTRVNRFLESTESAAS